MTEFLLGSILREMYDSASGGEQAANIHLFGIYYAETIVNGQSNKKEILKAAGLPDSYHIEVNKGVKLAKYAEIKEAQIQRIQKIQRMIKDGVSGAFEH